MHTHTHTDKHTHTHTYAHIHTHTRTPAYTPISWHAERGERSEPSEAASGGYLARKSKKNKKSNKKPKRTTNKNNKKAKHRAVRFTTFHALPVPSLAGFWLADFSKTAIPYERSSQYDPIKGSKHHTRIFKNSYSVRVVLTFWPIPVTMGNA